MPKGIPNKKPAEKQPETISEEKKPVAAKESHEDFTDRYRKASAQRDADIASPKPPAKEETPPLPAGVAYFESPEGYIMTGPSDKSQVWEPRMSKGKGGWSLRQR